jgi:hypothetical protein
VIRGSNESPQSWFVAATSMSRAQIRGARAVTKTRSLGVPAFGRIGPGSWYAAGP